MCGLQAVGMVRLWQKELETQKVIRSQNAFWVQLYQNPLGILINSAEFWISPWAQGLKVAEHTLKSLYF